MNAQENKERLKILNEASEGLSRAMDALWKAYELQDTQETYQGSTIMTELVNIRNGVRLPKLVLERLIKQLGKEGRK